MVAVGPDRAAPAEALLERDGELVAVRRLLNNAADGRGGLLALDAAPGLGKTALAERAVAIAARSGFRVRWSSGRELERGLGWGVARALFEPLLFGRAAAEREALLAGPACGAVPLFDAAEQPRGSAADVGFGILHGLYWLTARIAEDQPLLLVVDDAHWADASSLRFVLHLLGRVRDHRVAVVATMRAGEPGEGALLHELRADPASTVSE